MRGNGETDSARRALDRAKNRLPPNRAWRIVRRDTKVAAVVTLRRFGEAAVTGLRVGRVPGGGHRQRLRRVRRAVNALGESPPCGRTV
jgi:hypothetical protein